MKLLSVILLLFPISAFAAATPQWGGANSNTPPFNYISDTSTSFNVNSLNSLYTTINIHPGTTATKSLALKGCSAVDKGAIVEIKDGDNAAATYNIVITPTTGTIAGGTTYTISNDGDTPKFTCDGSSDWKLSLINANSLGLQVAAKCDGSTDDIAVINADILAASNAANGKLVKVVLPKGTCMVSSPPTIYSNIGLEGQGLGVTTIKLMANACTDVIVGQSAYSLFGTTALGIHDYAISNMTLDGNKDNQAGCGTVDAVNGLAQYGYHFVLSNLVIKNILGNGIRTEWQQFGEVPMEAYVDNVTVDTVGRRGVWTKGPHDSVWNKVIVIDASQETDNTYDALNIDTYGAANFHGFHAWHRSTVTNRARYSAEDSSGGSRFAQSDFEGFRTSGFHMNAVGGTDTCQGCRFFASFGGATDPIVKVEANTRFIIDPSSYISCSGGAGNIPPAISLAGTSFACPSGGVNYKSSGLSGTITGDNGSPGVPGETVLATANGTSATVTITIATPGVVTWTAHGFSTTTPTVVNFTTTGGLPTGFATGTNYWTIPGTVTANTFQLASSLANAFIGTAIATSGVQSGTHTGINSAVLASGTALSMLGINSSPGDWQCYGGVRFIPAAGTTQSINGIGVTANLNSIGNADSADATNKSNTASGAGAGFQLTSGISRQNISVQTPIYLGVLDTFAVSTLTAAGRVECRRMR